MKKNRHSKEEIQKAVDDLLRQQKEKKVITTSVPVYGEISNE